jgi:hypothetical protein
VLSSERLSLPLAVGDAGGVDEVPGFRVWEWLVHLPWWELRQMKRQLRAGPSFPVYEARQPHLGAGALADAEGSDAGVDVVGLVWGDTSSESGPMLQVRTPRMPTGGHGGLVEPDLDEVLADERDRLYDHAGVDEPEPKTLQQYTGNLPIDDRRVSVTVRREDGLWGARAVVDVEPDAVMVTVVARGAAFDTVRLGRVADLAPYLAARRRFMRQVDKHGPVLTPPEQLDLPPARGLQAHLAFVESALSDAEQLRSAIREGRRYRPPRNWGERYGLLREAAVRAQLTLAGDTRAQAEDAVSSLVNHLVQLAEEADWFADPALRHAAIDETIRYVVFDADVASRLAQQAWQRTWSARRRLPPRSDSMREFFTSLEHDRIAWLDAWRHWTEARGQ